MMLFAYFVIALFSLSAVMGAPVSKARRCVKKPSSSASDIVTPTSPLNPTSTDVPASADPTTTRSATSTEKPTSTTHTSTGTSSKPTSSSTSESSGIPAGWPFNTQVDSSKSSFGVSGNFEQSYLSTEEGKPTLVGNYPKGSYAGGNIAGFVFEANGGDDVDLENAKEAVLNYEVKFPEGFDFVLAGKLPGLYGGDDPEVAKTCAGGNHDDRCWSARLMWREDGKGELYAYLPTANQKLAVCTGKCDVHYGASIGTGSWSFKPGQWTQVTERVKLNDLNEMNGEIEISINGDSKINVNGLKLRTSESGKITGGMIHTFFGGSSTPEYQSPSNQQAFFRNFSFDVTEKL